MRGSSPGGSAQATKVALVVVAAGLGLAGFAAWNESRARALIHSPLSDMRHLHMATQQMTLDQSVTGGNVRWTCKDGVPMSRKELVDLLVEAGYLDPKLVEQMLSISVRMKGLLGIVRTTPDAYNIFAVTETDPDDTLFSATKNWHGLTSPGLHGEPFGTNGLIVFRKQGDGAVLKASQASDPTAIGGGGKFNYQALE